MTPLDPQALEGRIAFLASTAVPVLEHRDARRIAL